MAGVERRLAEAERLGFRRVFLSTRSRVTTGLDTATIAHVSELGSRLAA